MMQLFVPPRHRALVGARQIRYEQPMRACMLLAGCLIVGCTSPTLEPPPPAGSAAVPVAPPGARGAYAAGAIEPMDAAGATAAESLDGQAPADAGPGFLPPALEEDGGVAL